MACKLRLAADQHVYIVTMPITEWGVVDQQSAAQFCTSIFTLGSFNKVECCWPTCCLICSSYVLLSKLKYMKNDFSLEVNIFASTK